MGVSLTETAAEHVVTYLGSRGSGIGIRLAVKTTGCSGLMYVLEPVDQELPAVEAVVGPYRSDWTDPGAAGSRLLWYRVDETGACAP